MVQRSLGDTFYNGTRAPFHDSTDNDVNQSTYYPGGFTFDVDENRVGTVLGLLESLGEITV